jgi:hypothetical protein
LTHLALCRPSTWMSERYTSQENLTILNVIFYVNARSVIACKSHSKHVSTKAKWKTTKLSIHNPQILKNYHLLHLKIILHWRKASEVIIQNKTRSIFSVSFVRSGLGIIENLVDDQFILQYFNLRQDFHSKFDSQIIVNLR